ncbi:MAG: anhydro-N-acetylmuramic acid kinase [Colwellia sp.]|nr:anhydro-N-acetylmuramic acid kinase [Colwellia sp.]
MTKPLYYIGLMSGTSADGIDLALVDFSNDSITLVAKYYQAYDQETHQAITSLYTNSSNEIDRAFSLDVQLAHQFSSTILKFIKHQRLQPENIVAIGNHGQTIRHRPQNQETQAQNAFTLQIGCNQTLATLTNIRVVGQFRRKDMALGGQGAPLVPAFHKALFANHQEKSPNTFVVNIGGIANLSFLPSTTSKYNSGIVKGFDTGPGNALMDDWYQQHHNDSRYDKSGDWAAKGTIDITLLNHLLSDSYFQLSAPKSTGREIFHIGWLQDKLLNYSLAAVDVQATLSALTTQTICSEIIKLSHSGNIFLCGGGVLNTHLYQSIKQYLTGSTAQQYHFTLSSTDEVGIDSEALEAMAFAWFSYAFDHNIPGNIPAVTGARKAAVLGTSYQP